MFVKKWKINILAFNPAQVSIKPNIVENTNVNNHKSEWHDRQP